MPNSHLKNVFKMQISRVHLQTFCFYRSGMVQASVFLTCIPGKSDALSDTEETVTLTAAVNYARWLWIGHVFFTRSLGFQDFTGTHLSSVVQL